MTAALDAPDHQVVFGRRGTGKTHALRYVQGVIESGGDLAIYVDLRTIGSPEGLFGAEALPETERTARLLIDLLGQIHDAILAAVLYSDELLGRSPLVKSLDDLAEGITSVRAEVSEVEEEKERSAESTSSSSAGIRMISSPSIGLHINESDVRSEKRRRRELRQGPERIRLNFSRVAQAFRSIARELNGHRVWVLLDEWNAVPPGIQPLLGEFLVRCLLPLPEITVKIAAIEQQSVFRSALSNGPVVGIELGADVTANVNLDDFMVFEQNEERSRTFFRELLTTHLASDELPAPVIARPGGLISHGFRDKRAFDELVRAAEGVPRDAINIAAKAGMRAGDQKIAVEDVRVAAQSWFTSDKEAALRVKEDATKLLRWIINEVIRGKRARGFLVSQDQTRDPLLLALFDARVLHVVRRGFSAQDHPGDRFDVWVVDYGAYVDLISTNYRPQGTLAVGSVMEPAWVDVPTQDLRAIRRAILDLNRFRGLRGDEEPGVEDGPSAGTS